MQEPEIMYSDGKSYIYSITDNMIPENEPIGIRTFDRGKPCIDLLKHIEVK